MSRPTVVDFFCGAGGFSEGFRQQGFTILKGYDKWRTAIDTFNFNFGKDTGVILDILNLESEEYIDYIESAIPDTDVIIGSPPCVSFSTSNRSGKADKSMGVRLIEVFLKIVVIKKYKKGSILKAWYMENVAKSKDHTEDHYSFKDLGLEKWANKRRLKPSNTAIRLKGNTLVLNAADFGSPQQRLRAISGEVIKLGMMVEPVKVRSKDNYITLGYIRSKLPPPNSKINDNPVKDPLYPNITIRQNELTDHFYDSGLYECVWLDSRYLKINHPYMGRMSFPENENKPSRTITATNIGSSREALIYKSEYHRKGNGEFRIPTVREAATIMSFPITYQFIASEGSKWKLVGNAVCPSVSRA
ncbi:MAG: DNA cytosine methyltransferase, partial [Sphingobacteriales bacterium]